MRPIAAISAVLFFYVPHVMCAGLPPLTSNLWDLTYGSNDIFTGFSPASAVVSSPLNQFILLYGTPAPAGAERVLEFDQFTSADVCYSTACPSETPLYPEPNFVFNIGSFVFNPFNIVAGTGISSATTSFSFFGDLTFLGSGASFPSALGVPALFTGEDPGGTSSFVYFVNADGTRSNTLHVTDGTAGNAFLEGVLLDPPASPTLTLDILGFTDPGPNSSVTPAPTPEPATGILLTAVGLVIAARRNRPPADRAHCFRRWRADL